MLSNRIFKHVAIFIVCFGVGYSDRISNRQTEMDPFIITCARDLDDLVCMMGTVAIRLEDVMKRHVA